MDTKCLTSAWVHRTHRENGSTLMDVAVGFGDQIHTVHVNTQNTRHTVAVALRLLAKMVEDSHPF